HVIEMGHKKTFNSAVAARSAQADSQAFGDLWLPGVYEKVERQGVVEINVRIYRQTGTVLRDALQRDIGFEYAERQIIKSPLVEHGKQRHIIFGSYHRDVVGLQNVSIHPAGFHSCSQLAKRSLAGNILQNFPGTPGCNKAAQAENTVKH